MNKVRITNIWVIIVILVVVVVHENILVVASEVGPEGVAASKHTDYDGCHEEKGCLGLIEDCTTTYNCPAMVTYKYLESSNQFQFTLHTNKVQFGHHVAVGFSNDAKMGDDLVIYCATRDGGSPQLSWNERKSNVWGVQGLEISDISVTIVDGVS